MVLRRRNYPQADPRAADLMTRAAPLVPVGLPLEDAARVARHRRAGLLVARVGREWSGITPATVERALRLGLHGVGLDAVRWTAPTVAPGTPEVAVRRLLGPATPFVIVVERGKATGAVLAEPGAGRGLLLSVADALARLDRARGDVLRKAGILGQEFGYRVAAVGGLVRDLVLGGAPHRHADVDLAVEGDAGRLAAELAASLGGHVVRHDAFLTATVMLPDGGRVDVATARQEHYPRPGVLPAVMPGSLADDLGRRDFSVNALAVRLDGPAWGQVLDPEGGLVDLRRRRLRVLHPLSFIEDPTRIFRAMRFTARLRLTLERNTRRLLAAAAALPVYDALSGDRLRTEFEAALAEPAPADVLARLGWAGAFRLLLAPYRFSRIPATRLRHVADRAARLPLAPETVALLYMLALTAHLDSAAADAWACRLAVPPGTRAVLARARGDAPAVLTALARAKGPDAAYAVLHRVLEPVAAWASVCAEGSRVRRRLRDHLARWRHLRPALTGDDLAALGASPGPGFGRLLDQLVVEQVAGRIRDRSEAIAWVRTRLGEAAKEIG